MLAIVHPTQPTPSTSSSSSRSSSTRLSSRRHPILTSSSSSSSSSSSFSRNPSRLNQRYSDPDPPPPPPPRPPPPPAPTPPTPSRPLATHSASFDIHSYPSPDLLRLLASLLTQIAATNDSLPPASPQQSEIHPAPHTHAPSLPTFPTPIWRSLTSASRTALTSTSSTLTFHARNIPTISLEAYLLRILKYCPASNEVFLSLLVYFDRMSRMSTDATGKTFVIDSYNIHRLVIAGVTVASKFFSDVFYTNSRYAKVGGLPQAELNQLELQFLLLNDFRLVIHGDEMQRYAEQLILFSSSTSPDPSAPPPIVQPPPPARPSQAMGAVDAYGGRIPPEEDSPPQSNRTPNVRPRYGHARSMSESTTTTETETEPETEVETDGGETDDEPTIRPTRSSASSTCEDADSLYAYRSGPGGIEEDDTGDEGGDEEDGEDDGGLSLGMDDDVDVEDDAGGDLTPERKPASDERMSSP